jgi:hypothetical protein
MKRIAALAVAGLIMVPAAARAATTTTLAGLPGAAQALTAYGGWVVWSARDASGMWYLTSWHDGQVARLPAAPRSSPFDADAGPDGQGRPTLVYSRCTRDPSTANNTAPVPDWATARGCRLYLQTLGHGHERRLGGVLTGARTDSNYAPSIWGDRIAFARLASRAHTAQILLYRNGARLHRLAGGTPPCVHTITSCTPKQGHAGALALDLGPRVLALSWLIRAPNVGGVADGTELLAVPLDGRPNTLAESGFFSGTCGALTPNSPNAAGTGVAYLLNIGGDDCSQDSGSFQLFSPGGARQAAPFPSSPLPVAGARDGAITYWIGDVKPHPDTFYSYGDCVSAPTACSLMRSDSTPYQPSPRRRVLPPTY